MNRRQFAIGAACLLATKGARAEAFTVLHPHARFITADIDVHVVFALGSAKSQAFERELRGWTLPADVDLLRIHASGTPALERQQRAFYTIAALRRVDRLLAKAFESDCTRESTIGLLRTVGIDPAVAARTYDSAGVTDLMKQADARASAYEAQEFPSVVVDGRFRVSSGAILPVVDSLVKRVRAERAAR